MAPSPTQPAVRPDAVSPGFAFPEEARARLAMLIGRAGGSVEDTHAARGARIRTQALEAVRSRGIMAPVTLFRQVADERPDRSVAADVFLRALIARFALDLPETVAKLAPPPSILAFYPETALRLARGLDVDEAEYDWDSCARDIELALGLLLPAGAQDIDWNSSRRIRMYLAGAVKERRPGLLWTYFRHRLWRRWFETHTDSRHLALFTPAGWERAYVCIADLMRNNPDVPAYVATAWFYDPVVRDISPRLAYLQDTPLANGAYLIRNGPGEIHTRRATATSETRRRLVDSGAYVPTCYTLAWPRAALIGWADARRAG